MSHDQELKPILKDQTKPSHDASGLKYDSTRTSLGETPTPPTTRTSDNNASPSTEGNVQENYHSERTLNSNETKRFSSEEDSGTNCLGWMCCCACLGIDHFKIGDQWKHFILTVLTVILAVLTVVTLPVCLAGLDRVGGDAYSLLYLGPMWSVVLYVSVGLPVLLLMARKDPQWTPPHPPPSPLLVLLMGLANLIAQLLQLYTAVPSRTPAHLQVVLSTVLIPMTVFLRNRIFPEGIQRRQWACIIIVIIGVIISMVPLFASMTEGGNPVGVLPSNSSDLGEEEEVQESLPLYARVLWPMAFTISFIPQAGLAVMAEKHLKVDKGNPLVLCIYIQVITFVGALMLFWTDIIPGFGMASSIEDFSIQQRHTAQCMFGFGDLCHLLFARIWSYFLTYSLGFFIQILLICCAEGAIYSVLVLALVLPLGNMFWVMFGDNERYGRLVWEPQFETSTVFSFSGLMILIPPIAFYDYFGLQERKHHEFQRLQ